MQPANKGSPTKATMPAKAGPPDTGPQEGDPTTMKKAQATSTWEKAT